MPGIHTDRSDHRGTAPEVAQALHALGLAVGNGDVVEIDRSRRILNWLGFDVVKLERPARRSNEAD